MNITHLTPFVSRPRHVRHLRAAVCTALTAVVAACGAGDRPPTAPALSSPGGSERSIIGDFLSDVENRVAVCHLAGSGGHVLSLPAAAVAAHLAHGDYIASIAVDPQTTSAGDQIHFRRITDALAAVRLVRRAHQEKTDGACRITIAVAGGNYLGRVDGVADPVLEGYPLDIDVPDVTLDGGRRPRLNSKLRATSAAMNESDVATLLPNRPLSATLPEALVVVTDATDGYHGDNVIVNGFGFQSGYAPDGAGGGTGVLAVRARGLVVSNNLFGVRLASAVDLRATSGVLLANYAAGLGAGCGFCLGGPGSVEVSGNTLLDGGNVGIFVVGATVLPVPAFVQQYVPNHTEQITVSVVNNDLEDHTRQAKGVGAGVRVTAVGPGATSVIGTSTVSLLLNDVQHNSFGVIADAGAPAAASAGNVNLTMALNSIAHNCRRELLVAFSRHTNALGIVPAPVYVTQSTFSLVLGGNVNASNSWYDNPAGSPNYVNTLIVNGVRQSSTTVPIPYNGTTPCNP